MARNAGQVSARGTAMTEPTALAELRAKARGYMLLSRVPEAGSASRAEMAYQVLESLIASMDIPPGSVLNLDTLQEVVGLGRTPVREALKLLQADGIVEMRQRTGVTVPRIHAARQIQILQVRRPLERLASDLAAGAANRVEAEPLAALADELLNVGLSRDAKRMMRLGTACYHRLLALAGNEYLKRPLLSVYSLSRRYYYSRLTAGEMMVETTRLHHERFMAVVEGDEARAGAATERLLDYFFTIAQRDAEATAPR